MRQGINSTVTHRLWWKALGVAAGSAIALGVAGIAPAAAAALSQTAHYTTITDSWGTPTVPPPVTNNTNCPGPVLYDYTLANATGHGVQHLTVNGAGDSWFTSTFTGTGTVAFYPASELTFDGGGNVTGIIDDSQPDMVVSGHLTAWFGGESNKQNQVVHGTINFQGTINGSGSPISFHDNLQGVWTPGTPPGPPTSYHNDATC